MEIMCPQTKDGGGGRAVSAPIQPARCTKKRFEFVYSGTATSQCRLGLQGCRDNAPIPEGMGVLRAVHDGNLKPSWCVLSHIRCGC